MLLFAVVLTDRAVDAVDPLDVPGHGVDAGLLTPPHVLVEQVISLPTATAHQLTHNDIFTMVGTKR